MVTDGATLVQTVGEKRRRELYEGEAPPRAPNEIKNVAGTAFILIQHERI